MTTTYCIIVAAGSGSRFGANLPKQFCLLNDCPVIIHTINGLRKCLPDCHLILVLNPLFMDYWKELCEKYGIESPEVVAGGATRWESVKNAVSVIPDSATTILVHDGARPIINSTVVNNLITALDTHVGAIPALAVTDSLREVNDDNSKSVAIDRSHFRSVQTPQAFRAQAHKKAYEAPYQPTFTDDASVLESQGFDDIALVEGDPLNIKITNPLDIEIASLYLKHS